jgi:hypothetical protein
MGLTFNYLLLPPSLLEPPLDDPDLELEPELELDPDLDELAGGLYELGGLYAGADLSELELLPEFDELLSRFAELLLLLELPLLLEDELRSLDDGAVYFSRPPELLLRTRSLELSFLGDSLETFGLVLFLSLETRTLLRSTSISLPFLSRTDDGE